jgi:Nucleotidyl transferase AbiEii toxin, Type IV TA system
MPDSFEPRTEILPRAQQEIWPLLTPAPRLSLVLYGGTAIAPHLGHRISVDFDFFRTEPLNKKDIERSFTFVRNAQTIREDESTLVVIAPMQSGSVNFSVVLTWERSTNHYGQRTRRFSLPHLKIFWPQN